MARKRMISPEFFLHEELAELPALHRLLFIGLWTEADREGRIEDRPRRIKVAILPYDDCDVDEMLGDLADKGFVVRYEVEGERLISIPTFLRHQNPHIKEAPSRLPPPPSRSPQEPSRRQECQAPCEPGASPVLAPEEHHASRADTDTDPDTDLDPDTDTDPHASARGPDRLTPSKFVDLWNRRMGGKPTGPAEGKRLAGIRKCLKRRPKAEDWDAPLTKAKQLRATGECGWLDLDWLVRDVAHAERLENGAFDFKLTQGKRDIRTGYVPYGPDDDAKFGAGGDITHDF